MKLVTMAAVMSFVTKIEGDSGRFYQELAGKYLEMEETFLSFVKQNKRNEKFIKQTYFGVITDTIEACYSFEGLDTDDYEFDTDSGSGSTLANVVNMALRIEDKIQAFYIRAAELSNSMMADVPRAFKKTAQKREDRKQKLQSILDKA